MKTARAAAVVTWIYAAAFGLPAIPISAYLRLKDTCRRSWACSRRTAVRGRHASNPEPFRPAGGFPRGHNPGRLVGLVAMAGQAIRCCCQLALLPIEAIFWLGFAVPIPWLRRRSGRTARASWASLGDRSSVAITGADTAVPRAWPDMTSPDRRRALRIALPVLATVAIVAPLAWLWQASRVPSRYSVMEMGYHDYGGGAGPDTDGGHGSHGQGNGNGHHLAPRLVTDMVADPARPADVRVELVTRQQMLTVGGRPCGVHGERHLTRAGDPGSARSVDRGAAA